MPPKKSETPLVQAIPDQPPSFDNPIFMEEILGKAKNRDVDGVEAAVAVATRSEDYRFNLRQGIVVDFIVEVIVFSSQHGFNPRKASAFLKWMNEMRASIEETGSVDGARELFKQHLVSQAERTSKDGADIPMLADEATTPQAASKPAAKKEGKKAAKTEEVAPRPAAETNPNLTIADMGHVADFVVTGLLQHWRLYQFAANGPDPVCDTTTFTLTVQTPALTPALGFAMNQEQFDARQQDTAAKAEQELQQLRDEEAAAQQAEREAAEEAERERQRVAEELKANELYFEKVGTDKCVERIQEEVSKDVQARQEAVLARIARLESMMSGGSPS